MRLPVEKSLPLAALMLLGGCGAGQNHPAKLAPLPDSGPAADYPMIIGDPYTIDGKPYTPADTLNWDEVGYASIGEADGSNVSAAHKTLPLPSYVEVTSLASGKTILVRVERRGPMTNNRVIELSPGAAAQLGIAGATAAPVRVRRVNPPEQERAMLRGGGQAPERMETPKGLLAVLNDKLEKQEPLSGPVPTAASSPIEEAPPASEPVTPEPDSQKAANATASEGAQPTPPGSLAVQVAAFSTRERAEKAAAQMDGSVIHPGRYWLMRLGPFAAKTEAEAALAKAHAAGYSDARVLRAD